MMGRFFQPNSLRLSFAILSALAVLYLISSSIYTWHYPKLELQPNLTTEDPQPIPIPINNEPPATVPPKSSILLVTAMFPISKSKHSKKEYDTWVKRFLGPITTDIYVYTTPVLEEHVRKYRGNNLTITINTTYASPFDIPPLNGTEEKYKKMQKKDRQRKVHSTALYAFLNAKPFFVHDALQNLAREGKAYEYAFWNDRGSFREEHRYRDWPSVDRVREVWEEGERVTGTGKEDLMFFPIVGVPGSTMVFWNENLGPIDNEISEGSFFGGTPKAIEWWARTYYTYHNHYLSLDVFVGNDHSLINALLLLFPSRFITVYPSDPSAPAHLALVRKPGQAPLGLCGAERFYYQFWLAGGGSRRRRGMCGCAGRGGGCGGGGGRMG
ncbi:hypothetical protein B0H34DRAFT_841050 [Crassisporium funariophilum]|nr:hypothetical protein B0H34DRAFT_841050 [Crassisporium funariophilum]